MTKHLGHNAPTEPGWYWVRQRHGDIVSTEIVYVTHSAFGNLVVYTVDADEVKGPDDISGEWYGPLDSPFDD